MCFMSSWRALFNILFHLHFLVNILLLDIMEYVHEYTKHFLMINFYFVAVLCL